MRIPHAALSGLSLLPLYYFDAAAFQPAATASRTPDAGGIRVAAPAKLWLTAPAAKLRLATDE
jgi:hypothetical protein